MEETTNEYYLLALQHLREYDLHHHLEKGIKYISIRSKQLLKYFNATAAQRL